MALEYRMIEYKEDCKKLFDIWHSYQHYHNQFTMNRRSNMLTASKFQRVLEKYKENISK